MFTQIPNAKILVRNRSGCKVLELYVLNDTNQVYAKNGQYFVSILSNNLTSTSSLTWVKIEGLEETFIMNRLVYAS